MSHLVEALKSGCLAQGGKTSGKNYLKITITNNGLIFDVDI